MENRLTAESAELLIEEIVDAIEATEDRDMQFEMVKTILVDNGIIDIINEPRLKEVEFEELTKRDDTYVLYFLGPKELLIGIDDEYSLADESTIRIDIPRDNVDFNQATIDIAHTQDGSDDEFWPFDLSKDEYEYLMAMPDVVEALELARKKEYTLHVKYDPPYEINGAIVTNDIVIFDSLNELNDYVAGKVAYNHLDDTVQLTERETPLYAEDYENNIVWAEKPFLYTGLESFPNYVFQQTGLSFDDLRNLSVPTSQTNDLLSEWIKELQPSKELLNHALNSLRKEHVDYHLPLVFKKENIPEDAVYFEGGNSDYETYVRLFDIDKQLIDVVEVKYSFVLEDLMQVKQSEETGEFEFVISNGDKNSIDKAQEINKKLK